MPFDALTMAAVADDVHARAVEGRIQKIIQPSLHSIGLSVYAGGSSRWLLLSADARFARVHLSDGPLAKAFPTPSSFVMLLRKYLEGARLVEVAQLPHERVLTLTAPRARLVCEVMGRHSNIILIDDDDQVLGAVKMVPPRESRVRPILPGTLYRPPPSQERNVELFGPGHRLDPNQEPTACREALRSAPPDTSVRTALLGLLPGCGPFLASEIAVRAGIPPEGSIGSVDPALLVDAGAALYALYATRSWEPTCFQDNRGRPDFAPYRPVSAADPQSAPSISAAIEQSVQSEESRDSLMTIRSAVLSEVRRRIRNVEGRIRSLREGLAATTDAESVMQTGQLLLAYQYLAEPRSDVLVIPELEMTIPLEPRLSPAENAERLFRRYRKLRDASRRIPGLLTVAEAELQELRDLAAFVEIADSEADLRALERDVRPAGAQQPEKRGATSKRRGPPRFTLEGFTAIVGRSARENEEVTFRLAGRDDLWLHARERTGAHVILQGPSTSPPDEIVAAAAGLAAHFSEGRNDTRVDVDVARIRDVRKISGGPPGRVTYRNFRTVRVEPRIGDWQRSR